MAKILYNKRLVNYVKKGKGPAICLLHGFAEDHRIWDLQTEELSKKYTLIIPDMPGSGASEMNLQLLAGIDDYAAALKVILEQESIESIVLIGHSMGGYVSLAFAEKYPTYVAGLALFHSTAYADDLDKIEIRKKAIRFIQSHGSGAFLQTSIPGLFFQDERLPIDRIRRTKQINTLIEQAEKIPAEVLIQYYEAMIRRPDRTKILSHAKFPVLFILGKYDKAVPLRHGLEQSHIPDCCHLHILKQSAHMGMLEEPECSTEILTLFLQSFYS